MSMRHLGKVGAVVMSAATACAVIFAIAGNGAVKASEGDKSQDNTDIGISQISSPDKPAGVNSRWSGSYVYYGSYNGEPIKFRVLSTNEGKFGAATLFLDCDKVLFEKEFDPYVSSWNSSSLRSYLNNDFLSDSFSSVEQAAIYSSKIDGGYAYSDPSLNYISGRTVGLSGDKVFLLDAEDVTNEDYGYRTESGIELADGSSWDKYPIPDVTFTSVYNRAKNDDWWLRNSYSKTNLGYVCYVMTGLGGIADTDSDAAYGVSPALNIFKGKIMFSTLIADKSDESGAEYKLTLRDESLKVELQSGKKASSILNSVTVPYSTDGAANRVSALVLDKEYGGSFNNNNAKILYYATLEGKFSKNGNGTFDLPANLSVKDWGKKYHVYIMAESANGAKATDYASEPFELAAPSVIEPTATPTPAVSLKLDKSAASVICGKTVALKATVKGTSDKVTWKSSDSKIAAVDANGKVTCKMAGAATITASCKGVSASCLVTVLYKDVTNSKDFWYAPTNYLTAKGIVKGYDNQTRFKPANDCTRAQMVTFLYRLQGEPKTKSSTCKFKDVKKTDYFFKPVIWAVEKGITTGVSKTKFDPQGVCTRAQTVTFLWRMANKPAPKAKTCKFSDVKKKDYFYNPVIWASEQKIVAGYSDGTFKPQGKCLRRQMVTFLYKYDKFINGKG